MGRQINFYMNDIVEDEFISKIFGNGFKIIVENHISKSIVIYAEKNKNISNFINCYLYKSEYGDISYKWGYYIESMCSPVIEFSRTKINYEKKSVMRGRLWIQTQYFDSHDILIKQNPLLLKEYDELVKWIKNHVPNQEICDGYYKNKYYINKEILSLFEQGYRLY